MFTGKPQKNRAAATTYFDEHLSRNDYYAQDVAQGEQAGQWIGMGTQRLGLHPGSPVTREAFLRLCDNQHPESRLRLTRVMAQGRRLFFDFQCAPPKSVSILAITMNDQRLIQAHQAASAVALRELEAFAGARIRSGGTEDADRTTGNLVGASFLHTASRALDPQLHTHFVLFNATFDPREKRWKALQPSGLFDAIHYGTEVYRNELVRRLHQLGYRTRSTASAFEIEGVSNELTERFSKRSRERDLAVHRQEQRLGRRLTRNEIAHVVHQTRPKKLKGASEEAMRQWQLGELGTADQQALRQVVASAAGASVDPPNRVTEADALRNAMAHVFERASVVPQHRILEAALIHGRGQLDLDRLKGAFAQAPELVGVGSEFSTRDILESELFLIHTVNAGRDTLPPMAVHHQPAGTLGPDQRNALLHVITSGDRVTGFRGLAGTGKSTTLVELARILQSEGHCAVFCAPTTAAADTLRRDLKPLELNAVTIARLLADPQASQRLSTRSVLIVDEAAAVGLDDMRRLFELALRTTSRIVLVGDTGQHASVARGEALRILEQHSDYRVAELTAIRRQKPEAFRKAVELAARQRTDQAFAKLLELGAVTEAGSDDGQLHQQAADAYLSATGRGKSALLVSPTWAEIELVTERVRDTLKARGLLGREEASFVAFDSLSWTQAQRRHAAQYHPGLSIRFLRGAGSFTQGDTLEVLGSDPTSPGSLRLRLPDGTEKAFNPSLHAAAFDVGEVRELKMASGDWLLLQANHGKEILNGERVQVRGTRDGRIGLTDGRTLPAGYNTLTHGYAVTSHASQSRTVDEVLLVASSRSFSAVNREQFYVSISRGRERVHVFTDDTELLARRVTESHQRKAAIELQGLREALSSMGIVGSPRANASTGNITTSPTHRGSAFRTVRHLRRLRTTRMSPLQRLIQFAASVAQRLNRPTRTRTWTDHHPSDPKCYPSHRESRSAGRSRGVSV